MQPGVDQLAPTDYPDFIQVLLAEPDDSIQSLIDQKIETLTITPTELTSAGDVNPRNGLDAFPEDETELSALLSEMKDPESDEQAVRVSELHTALSATMGVRANKIPPHPFTPKELNGLCEVILGQDFPNYDLYVYDEPPTISSTLAGQYRDAINADIIRFSIEVEDMFVPFVLAPDSSEHGFGWYATTPSIRGGFNDAAMQDTEHHIDEFLTKTA